MGRPKKSEIGPIPTRERLFNKALELFALKGFEAVSVREITRALNLNEATLYIHYKNKSDLLNTILERFEKTLISPGFQVPPPETFGDDEEFSLAEILIEGGKNFFAHADRITLLIWRMLMISQYRYKPARSNLEEQILNPPIRFFTGMLENMKTAGKIRPNANCQSAGRIIAAMFFDYSFRSNLKAAWDEISEQEFVWLTEDLKFIADTLDL